MFLRRHKKTDMREYDRRERQAVEEQYGPEPNLAYSDEKVKG